MRSRMLAVLIFVFLGCGWLGAQALRIAVLDFSVQSDDPRLKYAGKGFAELTAVELSHIPGIILIDREKRNALLSEQEFSLSGSADEKAAIQVGKLLTADYLVSGSIIDMFGNLIVSYQVVRTDTGAIVGKEKTEGPPSDYRRMVGEIGYGIKLMTKKIALAAATPSQPAAKPVPTPPAKPPAEKQAAVLSTFSEAVAALDNKDEKAAQAKLEEARALDPSDPAVKYYLDKLSRGTSKFAVLPQAYYALDNPATLAFRQEDCSYFYNALGGTYLTGDPNWPAGGNGSSFLPGMVELSGMYGLNAGGTPGTPSRYAVREIDTSTFLGYETPLTKTLGLGGQVFFSRRENNLIRYNPGSLTTAPYIPGWDGITFYGGAVSLGWTPFPWIAIGVAGTVGGYDGRRGDWSISDSDSRLPTQLLYGGEAGLVLRTSDGSLVFAFSAGLSSYKACAFLLDSVKVVQSDQVSSFKDASLTWGFNRLHDFLVLKFVSDDHGVGEGSISPSQQLIPAFEHWFGETLSIRAGGVVTLAPMETLYVGYGGTLGATLLLGNWEIDLGGTYRMRPSYVSGNEIIPETVFSVGIRRNGLFVKP